MPCEVITVGPGITAWVRMSHGSRPWGRCIVCGVVATILCDYPIARGRTCDRPMCRRHAHELARNRHVCTEHKPAPRAIALELPF